MRKQRETLLNSTNKKRLANAYYSKKRYIRAALAGEIIFWTLFAVVVIDRIVFIVIWPEDFLSAVVGLVIGCAICGGVAMAIDRRRRDGIKELAAIRARYKELSAQ